MIHEIVQVIPKPNFKVYLYFSDGKIKLFNAAEIIKKGIFKQLNDLDIFIGKCTVLNHTLAWDIKGNYDPYNCLDLDPEVLYQNSDDVKDPLTK
ncbi:MAG TPA: DUF2442 domain-containing protein [Leptospiraceae bacterium]|nr:DUF2442 domain-containing protein [Leptospiraceae bacterium]HMW07794.1 DUF2442 domain-containing protein [Leptospiraceae bacterium]HMX35399.1 DUF2442 domain-containing protein [Leptospiraceae bacterium]HMY34162.1 DUF2442 domain-containing protein [Leptospiraceae bacterium]HMZ64063.1 DUF2442 domain-containing protein [Leptospiraceae bacterium]